MPNEPDLELLNDLLDGRLDAADEAALRVRMDAEPVLKEAFDDLARVGHMARTFDPALEIEVPTDFGERVRERVAADASPSSIRPASQRTPAAGGSSASSDRGRLLQFIGYGYAAAAVLVLGLVGAWMLQQNDTEAPRDLAKNETRDAPEDHWTTDELHMLTDGEATASGAGASTRDENAGTAPVAAAGPQSDSSRSDSPLGPPAGFRPAGPGGAVPPGMREPSDVPPPAPLSAPKAERGAEADRARRVAGRGPAERVVFILEVEDVAAVRKKLAAFLATDALAQDESRSDAETKDAGTRGKKAPSDGSAPAPDMARFVADLAADGQFMEATQPMLDALLPSSEREMLELGEIDRVPSPPAAGPTTPTESSMPRPAGSPTAGVVAGVDVRTVVATLNRQVSAETARALAALAARGPTPGAGGSGLASSSPDRAAQERDSGPSARSADDKSRGGGGGGALAGRRKAGDGIPSVHEARVGPVSVRIFIVQGSKAGR